MKMMKMMKIKNVRFELTHVPGSKLFKTLIIGYSGIALPVTLVLAILAITGISPTTFNDQEIFGIKGFIIQLIYSPIWIILWTVTNWAFLKIGFWVSSIFIKYEKVDDPN